jgi:hypothetical protein
MNLLAAPVSRVRVCDACRMAAEQLRSRSRPCLTHGPTESGAPHMIFLRSGLKTTARPPTCSPFRYFTSHTDLKALKFFSTFSRKAGPTGRRAMVPPSGRPARPGPERAGPAQRDGNPPDPPDTPLPATPGQPGGCGEGGVRRGVGGGILTALTRLGVGGRGGPPPQKPPKKRGVKNRCFLGKPPNLPTVSRG